MSVYTDLLKEDFLSLWQKRIEVDRTYFYNTKDGKIWHHHDATPDQHKLNCEWIYVNPRPWSRCDWYRDIEDTFKIIPSACLGCWKVVVRPRTLVELFKLWELEEGMVAEDPTVYCKCGIETRAYVFGNYGGYFYNPTKEALQERYKQVRELVNEKISPDVIVYPKRYCTEFERDHGPSDQYVQPPDTDSLEKMIEEKCHIVPWPEGVRKQDEAVRMTVIRRWIAHAWNVGDETVFLYTDGEPLTNPSVTYFPEEENKSNKE